MMRIEFLEAAEIDLAGTAAYYNMTQDNLGYEFLDEFKGPQKNNLAI
ncbi:MAG: hypothetical protein WAX69_26150 [Victivallales bacterium]